MRSVPLPKCRSGESGHRSKYRSGYRTTKSQGKQFWRIPLSLHPAISALSATSRIYVYFPTYPTFDMPRTMQAVRAQTGSAPRIAPRKGGRQAKAKSKVMGKKKAEPTVAEGLKAAGKGIVNALTGNEAEASKKTTIARPAIQTTTTAVSVHFERWCPGD